MTRYHWLLSGRVQGVGFRWFVLEQAEQHGLLGWVSNLPDGRVEVVASGDATALEEFEAALRDGPRLARVDRVEKAHYPHEVPNDKPFSVR